MKQYRGIVFDFDFTLANSSAGVEVCINHALAAMGFLTVEKSLTDGTIGLSLADTFTELTGIKDDKLAGSFAKHFIEKADAVMADMTVMLPGAVRVIPSLAKRGYDLGIVSTKYRSRIESILSQNNLRGYFYVIIGGEDVTRHKPDPKGLHLALSAMELSSETALYVGDSRTDWMTARNAGVDFAAVLTGVTGRETFRDTAWIFNNLEELADVVG